MIDLKLGFENYNHFTINCYISKENRKLTKANFQYRYKLIILWKHIVHESLGMKEIFIINVPTLCYRRINELYWPLKSLANVSKLFLQNF